MYRADCCLKNFEQVAMIFYIKKKYVLARKVVVEVHPREIFFILNTHFRISRNLKKKDIFHFPFAFLFKCSRWFSNFHSC